MRSSTHDSFFALRAIAVFSAQLPSCAAAAIATVGWLGAQTFVQPTHPIAHAAKQPLDYDGSRSEEISLASLKQR
jgi:hypothetical protein